MNATRIGVAIALVASLLGPGCAWRAAVTNRGFCAQGELADVRIGARFCQASDAVVWKDLEPASEQAMHAAEAILPAAIAAGIDAALKSCGVGVAGELVQACDIVQAAEPAVEKAVEQAVKKAKAKKKKEKKDAAGADAATVSPLPES